MKETFNEIECAAIQQKLMETHSEKTINMWQLIGHPNYLIVSLLDISTLDLMKLREMGLLAHVFGGCYNVEIWISKLN